MTSTYCKSSSSIKSQHKSINTSEYSFKNSIDKKTLKALEDLQKKTGFKVIQNNKERRFFDPKIIKNKSSSSVKNCCEIFVFNIPTNIFEDKLFPIFEKVGKLIEISFMMETSDSPAVFNKGFAFVQYQSKIDAEKAINNLNNYEIQPKHCLGVTKSGENNKLFVGSIPKDLLQEDVYKEMDKLTEGVQSVILYPSINDRSKNRGYAFVEYDNSRSAMIARKKLRSNPRPLLWSGTEIKVDWAEPEHNVDDDTMSKVKNLYVRNLSQDRTELQLKEQFSSLGGVVERVKKQKDYAFIHFATRDQAEQAKKAFNGSQLDGCIIEVSWAKPVKNRDEYQQKRAYSRAMTGSTYPQPYPMLSRSDMMIFQNPVRKAAGTPVLFHQPRFITSRQPKLEPTFLPPQQGGNIIFGPTQTPFIKPTNSELYGITQELNCPYVDPNNFEIFTNPSNAEKMEKANSPDEVLSHYSNEFEHRNFGAQLPGIAGNLRNGALYNPQSPYVMAQPSYFPQMYAPHMTAHGMVVAPNYFQFPATPAIPGYDASGYNQMQMPLSPPTAAFYQGFPVSQIPSIPANAPNMD